MLGGAYCLSAQAPAPVGMMTWQLSGTLPKAVQAQSPMPMSDIPKMQFQFGGDGKRFAMSVALADSVSDPAMAVFADATIKMVVRAGGDTVDVAIGVPAAARAMVASLASPENSANPPEGYRISAAMPNLDSLMKANIDKVDSVNTNDVKTRSLATTRKVGGLTCTNWQMITATDTVDVCVVENLPFSGAMQSWMASKLNFAELMKRAGSTTTQLFGGKMAFPIRLSSGDGSFVMEMVSTSDAAPPAAFFEIPTAFKSIDPKKLQTPG